MARAGTPSWKGLERLERRLKVIPAAVLEAVSAEVAGAADQVVGQLKAAYADDPKLQASAGWSWGEVTGGGSGALGRAKKARTEAQRIQSRRSQALGAAGLRLTIHAGDAQAFWARWREFGTRPHVIRPKSPEGELVFASRGRKVVAKEVMHPGARARPTFFPIVRGLRRKARSQVAKGMRAGAKVAARLP